MDYYIELYHGTYNRTRRVNSSISYIVVHYTGSGTSKTGSARANCIYFAGGNRKASADYFIDDGSIYEYNNPDDGYYTWHCGDGRGKYGITNSNSIGIEVCNNGGPYTDDEVDRLAWLVQKLMSKYGIGADHVVRHYDASRKQCPLYYVQNHSAWEELHALITEGADMNQAQNDALSAVWSNVTEPYKVKDTQTAACMRDRLAWMAVKQAQMIESFDALNAKIDALTEKFENFANNM